MLERHRDMVGLYTDILAVADIAHSLGSSGDKALDTAGLQWIESNMQPLYTAMCPNLTMCIALPRMLLTLNAYTF
jgi:hypothetical protein